MIRSTFAALVLICSSAFGVDIVVPSSPVQPGTLTILQLRDLAPKDQEKTTTTATPAAGVTLIPAAWGGKSFLIFQASRPGTYEVTLSINGWTKQLDDAVDAAVAAASPHESITDLIKLHTTIKTAFPRTAVSASIVVAGEQPPPVPVPVPTTGKRTIVILRETLDATPELSRIIIQLRDGDVGKSLKSRGHQVHILDKDQAPDWVQHTQGIQLPAIVITDEVMKTILAKERLPGSAAEVDALVKKTGGS